MSLYPTQLRISPRSCLQLLGLLVLAASSIVVRAAEPESCTLMLPDSPNVVEAECLTIEAPENRQAPDGNQIAIEVAILKARSANPDPDPVFFFAGGPGQSAIDVLIMQPAIFSELVKRRDVVFIDQRGTGRSNPLTCDLEDVTDTVLPDDELKRLTQECLATMNGDPRFYATRHAIADIDAIRLALGYEQINLMGISYGTRVAQEYLRYHPDQVRSIVIDGVVSPSDILGTEHSKNLTEALRITVTRCEADPDCNAAFDELAAALETYLDTDLTESREVSYRHPQTGDWQQRQATREELDLAIRMYAYSPSTIALLPLMIHRATNGEWQELLAGAELIASQMQGTMATGMHNAVMCSEDVPFYPDDLGIDDNALMMRLTQVVQTMCDVWPIDGQDNEVHKPLTSDTPALLLSGELDPVTPPHYGDKALKQFSRGTHLTGLGLGHSVAGHRCFRDIIAGFVDTLAISEEDLACTSTDWSAKYFTSFNGAGRD